MRRNRLRCRRRSGEIGVFQLAGQVGGGGDEGVKVFDDGHIRHHFIQVETAREDVRILCVNRGGFDDEGAVLFAELCHALSLIRFDADEEGKVFINDFDRPLHRFDLGGVTLALTRLTGTAVP